MYAMTCTVTYKGYQSPAIRFALAAVTIAEISALTAPDRLGQLSTMASRSGSIELFSAASAPDFAPLWAEVIVFPGFSAGVRVLSSPLLPAARGSKLRNRGHLRFWVPRKTPVCSAFCSAL